MVEFASIVGSMGSHVFELSDVVGINPAVEFLAQQIRRFSRRNVVL